MGTVNQDPSMEEILASIKRVIADDGLVAHAPNQPRAIAPEDDVLELNDPVSDADRLMSDNATVASRQSLATLAATREAAEECGFGGNPLESMVREMLRPVLKEWLDANLPDMIEDLVTREIARITGKPL